MSTSENLRVLSTTKKSVVALVFVVTAGCLISRPRGASAERVDAPLTLAVETPHIPWDHPSPGAPIHAYVVPTVSEGRTLVELAERMDLAFDTVTMDEAWDVNTWTVGTDQNYEARNYKLLYGYLTRDLTGPKHYDVIVLPSLHGWNRLPQTATEAILKRVREGAGLVLIHPTTGVPAPDDPKVEGPLNNFIDSYAVRAGDELWQVSPLVDVLSDRLDAHGFREIRPDAVASGPWSAAPGGSSFITTNVPLGLFPTDFLKHYRYKLGHDSTALALGPQGEPIVATKTYGQGRVVGLGYLNDGLAPMIDKKILGEYDDHWWEYFYSLLCRSVVWAAKRTPALRLDPLVVERGRTLVLRVNNSSPLRQASLRGTIVNEWGEQEGSFEQALRLTAGNGRWEIPLPASSSAGRHEVDVLLTAHGLHYDWGTAWFDVPKADAIVSVSTDREFYKRGGRTEVSVKTRSAAEGEERVELLDNRGRLLARARARLAAGRPPSPVALPVGNYTTNIGWVRVALLAADGRRKLDQKQVRVNFEALDRAFGAYEMILPWYGPPSYQPWTPALDQQLRKAGVTVVEDPTRNFRLIDEIHAPGFGVYWHYREPYIEQKDEYLKTHDTKYLIREPDLASDQWLARLRTTIRDNMKGEPFRPLAYYLADESSLTAYGDPLDFSWSSATLVKLREWLKTQYSSLDALNREWGTTFLDWDRVLPFTTRQAQERNNYAGWMDHRTFMEQVFANAVQVAADTVKQQDPGALPSISGTQAPGPSNGVNWYLLDQIVDYLQPYSGDDQDELHRTMRPGLILTGFTGYGSHGAELRHELWHRLLHGQIGASVFWQYTMLNADLSLTEQGRDLASVSNELRNEGLALLLRGARRENCGIAVHYSLRSVKGEWITGGHIQPHEVVSGDATSAHLKRFHHNRHAWLQALEDAGYQYDFLTTEQIEAGGLFGYRVLILPDSIALTDGEARAIRQFVRAGGSVIADAETGLMDGHGRWQSKGMIDDVLGVARSEVRPAPSSLAPVTLATDVQGDALKVRVIPAGLLNLRPASSAQPHLEQDGTAYLIENRYGAGRAVTLNFWMTDYAQLRKAATTGPRLALLHKYLGAAGVHPVVEVYTASAKRLACSEVVAYWKGTAEYLAILPEPTCRDAGGIRINLPAPRYVYDLRAHKFLGHTDRLTGNLVASEPLFYALEQVPASPPAIASLRAAGAAYRVRAGDTARFTIRLLGQYGQPVPDNAVHIEVHNAAGTVLDYYGTNVAVSASPVNFSIPLALNDALGRWRVTVREPFAHQTAHADFVVVR